ncbi:MAG TPA: MFS transporter [Bacillota bacterium]|nr:MFS transporter [Bacillota bacterium]HPT88258.1 MFS transporter [Bacillota bacterium]
MIINRKLQLRLLSKNIWYSYIDGMAFCFMLGIANPYLGIYILRFGGPQELVSLITSVQPIVLATVSLFGASYASSFQKKKALLIPHSILMRMFVLLFAFIPLLPHTYRAWSFFLIWAIMNIPWAFCNLSWAPMMNHIIPEEQRGRFFGTRNALTGVTTLIGTFITGVVLTKYPFDMAFSGLFAVGFISVMVSMFFLARHIEPVVPEAGESKKTIRSDNSRIFELDIRPNLQPFTDPQYGSIFSLSCLAIFIFHIGYSMAVPLFTLRQVNQLAWNNSLIAIIANVSGLTAFLGSYLSGRAADRWGFRYVLFFSTLLSILPPLIWATSTQFAILVTASMLWGFTGSAYMICFTFMVLAVAPRTNPSRFVAMNTVIGNLAGGLGPILGLFLVKIPWLNIEGSLMAAATIMFAGALFSAVLTKRGTF